MELLPFAGYYITMLGIAIILDAICPFLKIYWHFDLVLNKLLIIINYGEYLQIFW